MDERKYIFNEFEYKLINNYKDGFSKEETESKLTDYFNDYDYVVGDWSYNSLRLKGFCKKENKKHNQINSYSNLEKYLKDKCAYGCKYFVLEKIVAQAEK